MPRKRRKIKRRDMLGYFRQKIAGLEELNTHLKVLDTSNAGLRESIGKQVKIQQELISRYQEKIEDQKRMLVSFSDLFEEVHKHIEAIKQIDPDSIVDKIIAELEAQYAAEVETAWGRHRADFFIEEYHRLRKEGHHVTWDMMAETSGVSRSTLLRRNKKFYQ